MLELDGHFLNVVGGERRRRRRQRVLARQLSGGESSTLTLVNIVVRTLALVGLDLVVTVDVVVLVVLVVVVVVIVGVLVVERRVDRVAANERTKLTLVTTAIVSAVLVRDVADVAVAAAATGCARRMIGGEYVADGRIQIAQAVAHVEFVERECFEELIVVVVVVEVDDAGAVADEKGRVGRRGQEEATRATTTRSTVAVAATDAVVGAQIHHGQCWLVLDQIAEAGHAATGHATLHAAQRVVVMMMMKMSVMVRMMMMMVMVHDVALAYERHATVHGAERRLRRQV